MVLKKRNYKTNSKHNKRPSLSYIQGQNYMTELNDIELCSITVFWPYLESSKYFRLIELKQHNLIEPTAV